MLKEAFDAASSIPENISNPTKKSALQEAWRILVDAEVTDPLEAFKPVILDRSARRRSYPLGIPFDALVFLNGQALREARVEKGLSLSAAGKLVGLNQSTLSRLENNKYRHGVNPKLAEELKTFFGENITGTPQKE